MTAQRIYQDLVSEHQYVGGYNTVNRFVRQLRRTQPEAFLRIEVEPGTEAQVDLAKAPGCG